VLADRYQEHEWNWAAARRELMEAAGLAPDDPSVLGGLAQESLAMGRPEEALRYLRSALTVEPLDPWLHFSCTVAYLGVGRFSEAEASARRALEISPTYGSGRLFLAMVLLAQGRAEEAHAELAKEADPSSQLIGYAMTQYALGRRVEADAVLARLEKQYGSVSPMWVAQVYAYRGEKDHAFEWLERAYGQHDTSLWSIKQAVFFQPLERDPRFIALLRKMGLPT
jgi:serine/threonine-protein kinase